MNPISPLRPTPPPTPTPILPPRGCFKQERKGQMAAGRQVMGLQHLVQGRVQRHLWASGMSSTSPAHGAWWLLAPCLGVDASCDQRPPSLPPSGSLAFFFPPASLRAKHPASGQDAASWQGWAFLFSSPHPVCPAWAPLIQAGAKLPHRLPGRIPPSLFPEGTVTLSH